MVCALRALFLIRLLLNRGVRQRMQTLLCAHADLVGIEKHRQGMT